MKSNRIENHMRINRASKSGDSAPCGSVVVDVALYLPVLFFLSQEIKLHVRPLTKKKNDLTHSE